MGPMGPRQPDKRNTAYESIFGRPSATHHHQNPPPLPYTQSPQPYQSPQFYPPSQSYQSPQSYPSPQAYQHPQGSAQPYPYYSQQQLDRRTSHSSSTRAPSMQYPSSNRQSRYSTTSQPHPSQYSSAPLAPPAVSTHARSVGSSAGVIAPPPADPPDANLEALTRAGLTPAQAYQVQVYRNSPASGPAMPDAMPDAPHIGLNIDADDGRLGIEFVGDGSSRARTVRVDTALPPSPSPGRRSSESSKTVPVMAPAFPHPRTSQDRVRSMSATVQRPVMPLPTPPAKHQHPHHRTPRMPTVYPALLSRVAEAFKARITLGERTKDGLTYADAFDGRAAVDVLAYIIKTTDRNLALLLGRALDAQKFFHAVTYDHRLRDSSNDLYQFRTRLPTPFASGELMHGEGEGEDGSTAHGRALIGDGGGNSAAMTAKESPTPSAESETKEGSRANSPSPAASVSSPVTSGRPRQGSVSADEVPLPTGVFTLLTDCYSPTCTRDQLCYSIACPRRLEQQARLNMKPQPGLKKQLSRESLGDLVEPGTLWIHSVPPEVVNSVSDTEKKRQEAINEVIYTERDFVRDMEYLRDLWIKPLRESEIIPEARRADFLEQVFWNIHDIIAVNTKLRDALNKRQKAYAVVEQIGDVLLDAVPHFQPFVSYGAHQLYGKYEFEKEKSSNPQFARFVEEVERRPESRKLELNGYLTKPTTRLARYPLLLGAVLKHTSEDSPDKGTLPKVIEIVKGFLKVVNTETGKAENRFNLLQLDQQLVWRQNEFVDLRLKEEGRELIYKGALKKRGGAQGDSAELQVFLFDHALLMVKPKSKGEQYKVYRKPTTRQKQLLTKNAPHAPVIPIKDKDKDTKGGFSITFVHLGRNFYQITLWASTYVSQRKWMEHIQKQQELMRQRSNVFETVTLSEGFFVGVNRVNCAAPFSQGKRAVYGTDDGVYLSNLWEQNREPVKVLALKDVAQVDVLEDYQLLIVLSERQVITFPLDALDPRDPLSGLKRAKRIASHISFFKAGLVVKASPLSSTIKTLEPIDQNIRGRSKPTFRKLLQGGNDTLREFYIPVQSSSIHFLKTKLCVGCTNGFEIVDLETLDTQGLLDPADASLDFVRKRENLRPIAIYRIDNEFLLCYDEFAFYVNKTGWRSRKDFMVYWEGSPSSFALHYPYVLAFEPTFVEIHHVETGSVSQIVQGNNLRCLFADTPPSTTHSANQYNNPYQLGYNPYGSPVPSPTSSYGSRASLNGYGPPPPPYPNPYQARVQQLSRSCDEILMVSDDRVMRLQMSIPPAQ
ncbi:Rho1 guanine nucleotide exchange factor 1 [Grifola frondosa]|uniref:Rho1 guanine nucleotide exchange factor 1 n=1 Tax=Grifola frondosa TaxID=5627 RepID=A0A1C7MBG7_GRIFR|nr:Rho1 guanine nucleotide exchange factor 1 [Grifola frondosa]